MVITNIWLKSLVTLVFCVCYSSLLNAQTTDDDILDFMPAIIAASTQPEKFECVEYVDLVLESNTIESNTRIESGCYNVNSSIRVSSGRLIIAPAVELRFASNLFLYVGSNGSITAEGSARQPIIFSGIRNTRGFWKGIELENTSSGFNSFKHVRVENGGDSTGDSGIEIQSVSSSPAIVKLDNVTVSGSLGYGVGIDDTAIINRFARVTMSGNRRPIYIHGNDVHILGNDSGYTGNQENFVYIERDDISTNQTWKKLSVPYHAESIWVEASLELQAGVNLKFFADSFLRVGFGGEGVLTAQGTPSQPIIIEGVINEKGAWDGLEFNNVPGQNLLEYVEVINGGDSVGDSGIDIESSTSSPSRISLKNVSVSGSLGYGIGMGDGTIVDEFSSVIMTDNRRPIYIHGNYVHVLGNDSIYTGNEEDFVYIEGDDISTNQTWKKLGVPYHAESIWVEANVELQAGVNLKFFSGSFFRVGFSDAGRLTAQGTALQPIIIEGVVNEEGSWDGLEYNNISSGTNLLEYVEVRNGGDSISDAGIDVESTTSSPSRISFNNVSVSGSLGYGVFMGDGVVVDDFSSVTMTDNRRPILLYGNHVSILGDDSLYTGNDEDFVYIESDTVTTNQTWNKLSVPYHSETIRLDAGLTLQPGVDLKFFSSSNLDVSSDGALNAEGTVEERISIGGVENTQGFWDGIEFAFSRNVNNKLIYVDVSDGASSPNGANIKLICTGALRCPL